MKEARSVRALRGCPCHENKTNESNLARGGGILQTCIEYKCPNYIVPSNAQHNSGGGVLNVGMVDYQTIN